MNVKIRYKANGDNIVNIENHYNVKAISIENDDENKGKMLVLHLSPLRPRMITLNNIMDFVLISDDYE